MSAANDRASTAAASAARARNDFLRRLLVSSVALAMPVLLFHCKDQENEKFVGAAPIPDEAGTEGGPLPRGAVPHPNTNPQPRVTECSRAPLTAPATGTCAVTKAGAGAKVLQGTVLAADEVLHRGEVLVDDGGVILCVGCDCSTNGAYATATVIACADGVISPGLVNPHEHLTYQNNAPVGHGDLRYENRSDWQGARGHARLEYASSANQTVQAFGELRFLMSGTTSIAGGGGVPGLIRNLDTQPDELEGLPAQIANSDVFPLSTPGKNLASGCDYSPGRTTGSQIQSLASYLPHISEGIDVEARNEFVCTSADGQYDLVRHQTSVIHGVALAPGDAKLLRDDMAKVVWSPRSNVDLYGNTASVVMLDLAGVAIALGTDWVPSGSMNMLRELRCADSLNKTYFDNHFTDADLWRMATQNAAVAVGAAHAIGMLKAGYLADVAVYDGKLNKDFRAVLDAGVEDVALVLRGGKTMYGDAALVADASLGGGAGCEAMAGDVCGRAKMACIDVRIGGANPPDLAAIRAAGEKYYPLFFCRDAVPTNEPSCVPARSLPVKGSTVYSGKVTPEDRDGDGIVDAADDCPTIFNPVRPMDQGRQADADNDGIGDACDPCPNDPAQACAAVTGGDLDGDGVPNAKDNCPEVANPNQADADGDGRGDACDACAVANPGATPCPLAISTIRNPSANDHPAEGTVVKTTGFVSARKTGDLFFVQEATTGAPWQGIYVLAGDLTKTAALGPKVGQKISVVGVYSEVFNVSQLTAATVTVDDATVATMTPLVVTPAQYSAGSGATAEPLEGLLMSVEPEGGGTLAITNDNPDTGPFFEFVMTGNVRVDDFILPRHGTPATCDPPPCPYPPPTFSNGRTFTRVVGLGGFSFGNRKIYPRTAADFQ